MTAAPNEEVAKEEKKTKSKHNTQMRTESREKS
jgi:hypothetical protein